MSPARRNPAPRTCPFPIQAPTWSWSLDVRLLSGEEKDAHAAMCALLGPTPKIAARRGARCLSLSGIGGNGPVYASAHYNTHRDRACLSRERGERVGAYEVALRIEGSASPYWYAYGNTPEEAFEAADAELRRQGWTLL